MKIIDTHAHIYPAKIASLAKENTGAFYNLKMHAKGATAQALIESGEQIGVSKYIVHSTATKVKQVKSINNFVTETTKLFPQFIGYATLHEEMSLYEIEDEVNRIIKAGLKGFKLHPDFQRFNIDSKKATNIYQCVAGRLPILFHVGDMRYDFSSPVRLSKVAKSFPTLTCIAAHLGGYTRWDEALLLRECDNVFFDTSSTLFRLPKERAKNLIDSFGYERVMFGVDFPMWTHADELQRFLSLGLSAKENEAILSQNAQRLLNVKI